MISTHPFFFNRIFQHCIFLRAFIILTIAFDNSVRPDHIPDQEVGAVAMEKQGLTPDHAAGR